MEEEKGMPLFIKVENYKEVLELMRTIKKRIAESKRNLEKISSLKAEEDSKIEEWEEIIMKLEKKIDFVDENMFEPKV
jgi:hypothetical protein